MAIKATSKGGGDFDPIDAGSYGARCISMIHIGTRIENIMGKDKETNKVYITWEVPGETIEIDGNEVPRKLGKEYSLSMHPKSNLRKDLDAWRGKAFTEEEAEEFDVTNLLGKPAMITAVHKTAASKNVYANISGVAKPPKEMKVPKQINDSFEFNYEDFAEDNSILESIPEFIQDKIKESDEYREAMEGVKTEPAASKTEDDDEETMF